MCVCGCVRVCGQCTWEGGKECMIGIVRTSVSFVSVVGGRGYGKLSSCAGDSQDYETCHVTYQHRE